MAADALFWHHLFGSNRVVRGGSWNNNANNCRSGNRNQNTADNRNNNIGFRVCSAAPAQKTGRMSLPEPDDACVLLTEDVPGGRAGSDCGAVANVLPPPSTLMVRLKNRQGARTHRRERWTIFLVGWPECERCPEAKGKSGAGAQSGRTAGLAWEG